MAIVYINIGSNLGNKRELIAKAVDLIGDTFGFYCKSDIVETEPWGFDSTNRFFNIGVAFKSELHPEKLLDILQAIEKNISSGSHRDENGNYTDREIDIDIMAIDEMIFQSNRLCIPHKHLLQRDFFMTPLKELAPSWKFPKHSRKIL